MSVPEIGSNQITGYVSKAVTEKKLENAMCNSISAQIEEAFQLKHDSQPISVNAMLEAVNMLSSGNQVDDDQSSISSKIHGVKCFSGWPAICKDASSFPQELTSDPDLSAFEDQIKDVNYLVPNAAVVNTMIGNQPVYFSTTDGIASEGNPLNINGKLEYATTIGSGKFYFWRIDQNKNDSSDTIYDYSQTASGSVGTKSKDQYQEMADTGQLVVWGWLADNGNVAANHAWVGMFAQMKYEGGEDYVDLPISIHPWIRGQYASTLQYVSFTVPVKKGLRLKIKTGFPVSNDNSGFQNGNTLTFVDRWVPNAFFGYIIK